MPATESAATALEHAVTIGVLGLGAVIAAWYLATGVTLLACAATSRLGRRWEAGEAAVRTWGAPVLRRAAGAAAGLALGAGLGVTGAMAAAPPALPDDLGWQPMGSQPASAGAPTAPVGPRSADDGGADRAGSRVVQPGDSLWAIAAADLADRGRAPVVAAIAEEWPRWYAANRALLGPDPHLIRPGQELQPPPEGAHR